MPRNVISHAGYIFGAGHFAPREASTRKEMLSAVYSGV
jgi:hypothetical protein